MLGKWLHMNTAMHMVRTMLGITASRYEPKAPHTCRLVVDTDQPHRTREGKVVMNQDRKRPRPVMLKYEQRIDRAKRYPYSSVRQDTRVARRADRAAAAM
jgi:hypothetical protein